MLENIIVDFGIGFGKIVVDNFVLFGNFFVFYGLGFLVFLGVFCKSYIGKVDCEGVFNICIGGLFVVVVVVYV